MNYSRLVIFITIFFMYACGGGSSGSSPAQGTAPPSEPTITAPPALLAFSYTGSTTQLTFTEKEMPDVLTTAYSVSYIPEFLDRAFNNESSNFTGDIKETESGSSGGSADIEARLNNGRGWLKVTYKGFAQDGVIIDGLFVQRFNSNYGDAIENSVLEFHDLEITTSEETVIYQGKIERETDLRVTDGVFWWLKPDIMMTQESSGTQTVYQDAIQEYSRADAYGFGFTGTVFLESAGYLAIETVAPISIRGSDIIPDDIYPLGGGELIVRGGDKEFAYKPLTELFGSILLDRDGDGMRESTFRIDHKTMRGQIENPNAAVSKPISIFSGNVNILPFIDQDDSFTLNGLLSFHGSKFINYEWSILHEPLGSQVILENANSPIQNVSNLQEGYYLFELKVNDGDTENISSHSVRVGAVDDNIETVTLPFSETLSGSDKASVGEEVFLDNRLGCGECSQQQFHWRITGPTDSAVSQYIEESTGMISFTPDVPGRYFVDAEFEQITNDNEHIGYVPHLEVFVDTDPQFHQEIQLSSLLGSNDEYFVQDFTGDGINDLVTKTASPDDHNDMSWVHIFKGTTSGYLEEAGSYYIGRGKLAVGDVNNNGLNDLVVAIRDEINFISFANEAFSRTSIVKAPGCDPQFGFDEVDFIVRIADLNGDMQNELIVSDGCRPGGDGVDYTTQIFKLNAEGNFVLEKELVGIENIKYFNSGRIDFYDFDNDQDKDLVQMVPVDFSNNMRLQIFENDGNINFTQVLDQEIALNTNRFNALFEDIDDDADTDMIFFDGQRVRSFTNQLDGLDFVETLLHQEADFFKNSCDGYAYAYMQDIDNDGDRDIVSSGHDCLLLLNKQSDGTFTTDIRENQLSYQPRLYDINSDGLIDQVAMGEFFVRFGK